MYNLVLFCAVATGNYGFEIVECYDTPKACEEEISMLECTKCYADEKEDKTICPSYGAVSYE